MKRELVGGEIDTVIAILLRLHGGLHIVGTRDNRNREVVILTSTQSRTILLDMNLSLPLVAASAFWDREGQTTVDVAIKTGIETA